LEKTTDILANVSRLRHNGLLVVGFAAETDNVLKNAREKLKKKNLDLIVANDVSDSEIGFGSDLNKGAILRGGSDEAISLSLMSKREMAERILDEILNYRETNKRKSKS
jgi:phosphopantothenoylcysteine decarboxylase/phosphopantothenate--cysteine ligase